MVMSDGSYLSRLFELMALCSRNDMRTGKRLAGCCIALLWSLGSGSAAPSDFRLIEAVKNRNIALVHAMLQERVDVNTPQADGATALHWAALLDDVETTDLLIRAGAQVDAANDYGVTPLALACTNGRAGEPVVERLLKAGANPNSARQTGETVLMTAARSGSLEAVKLLLDHGADVNAKESRRGQTALMWAAAERHPDVMQALIGRGADIRVRSKGGFTALLFAAQQGDRASAERLLAAGADINETTPDGATALLVATISGLQRFETDDVVASATTVARNHGPLITFLLEKGANPNAADAAGVTPLHAAALHANVDLVRAFLPHGANPNPRLVKNPPGLVDMVGATPFLLAAFAADAGIMRLLAANGADPLLTSSDKTTALMLAAGLNTARLADESVTERRALEAVTAALDLGADVNAVNEVGRTALFGAADMGRDMIVRLLADRGAAADPKDKYGDTPFSYTLRANHASTGALLRTLGADPTTTLHCDSRLSTCR